MEAVKPFIKKISTIDTRKEALEYLLKEANGDKNAWIAFWMTIHFLDPEAGNLCLLTTRNTVQALLDDEADHTLSREMNTKIDNLVGVDDVDTVFQTLNLLSLEQLQISDF